MARLTLVNLLLILCAFVTSPILARALGPSGRGEVAAIFVVVGIAPWVCELGVSSYLTRERARHVKPLGVLLGSTIPIAIAGSLIGMGLAVPLAHALGHGRPVVIEFIELALFLLPLSVFAGTLAGIAIADQRWAAIMANKVINTLGAAVAIVALSLLHAVTVESVAITYITCGILSGVPLLVGLRGSRPWRFTRPVAREGLAFGVRSWLSSIADAGNYQLDQVLMAGLVSSRQLGLYSLGVTLASAPGSLLGATSNALFSRVASGESLLAARACRVNILLIIVFDVGVAATSPWVVPFVFGRAFTAAIPMLILLLAANVFAPPTIVLGSALIAAGDPSAPARGQLLGLAVTVPALIIVLPRAGGIGAACVSLVSYSVTFAIILAAASKTFKLSYRTLLVVTRQDLRWLWARVRRRQGAAVLEAG